MDRLRFSSVKLGKLWNAYRRVGGGLLRGRGGGESQLDSGNNELRAGVAGVDAHSGAQNKSIPQGKKTAAFSLKSDWRLNEHI